MYMVLTLCLLLKASESVAGAASTDNTNITNTTNPTDATNATNTTDATNTNATNTMTPTKDFGDVKLVEQEAVHSLLCPWLC